MHLTSTIAGKIGDGVKKTESVFSLACIYRVPEELRKLKESAYTPRLISIGPLHREDKHLQTPLQHVKMSYANHLFSRLTAGMEDHESALHTMTTVLQNCLAGMRASIDVAKKFYAEEVTLDEEMMLIDGCFILEFLYRFPTFDGQKRDPIFGNTLTLSNVKNDLVLLENQIPFFVLEKLFQLTVGEIRNRPDENWSLTNYLRRCYDFKMSHENKESISYCHILHNLQDWYRPVAETLTGKPLISEGILMPSASELKYAGVKFVPDEKNKNLFKFSEPKGLFRMCGRPRFKIPTLTLYNETELYLRNLIAFEQSCPGIPAYVTSYVFVMDTLVNSDSDIKVLEKAKVMSNYLGAREDATRVFNKICKEAALGGDFFFAGTCSQATKYSKRFWPRYIAASKIYGNPWMFRAFFVGFVSFVISVVQFARSFFRKY
ncbi:UPF0481 protein At3g47200-like [Rhododendron vialii]|uniref:UPF0481 protein At3g47200-like n=1 Tax=Rhododendron vialii TaxID=182163 RepID=UPI00265D6507|nr:UPF0481 protein At3g47200-like [Rhododendron vialii]